MGDDTLPTITQCLLTQEANRPHYYILKCFLYTYGLFLYVFLAYFPIFVRIYFQYVSLLN